MMGLRRTLLGLVIVAVTGCSLMALDEGEFSGGRPGTDAEGSADVTENEGGANQPDSSGLEEVTADAGVDAATSRYARAVLEDEPILYWRLGESTGTTAKATAGSDGTYSVVGINLGSPGALADDPDTAVTLTDGAGRITLDMGASFDALTPYSVEVWVKPSASNTNLGFVIDHTDWGADERRGWCLLGGQANASFERWASKAERSSVGNTPLTSGEWHHLVGTFDGTTTRFYIDNVRIEERKGSIELPSRTSRMTVGHTSCDCGHINSFIGDVDELAVYDKPLTETRIATHYAAAK